MTAVLVLYNSSAIVVPAWFWIVAVVVSMAIGAVAQWIASARSKRRAIARAAAVLTAVVGANVLMIDGCWVWTWLCLAF